MSIIRSTYYIWNDYSYPVIVVGFVRDERNNQTLAVCIKEDGKWFDVPLDMLRYMEKF